MGAAMAQWDVPTQRRFLTVDSIDYFWQQVQSDPDLKWEVLDVSFWEDTFTMNVEGKDLHFTTIEGRTRNTYVARYDDIYDIHVEGWIWSGAPDLRFGMKARYYNRIKQKFMKRKEPFFEPVLGTPDVVWGMWVETYTRKDVARLSKGYVITFGAVVGAVMVGVLVGRLLN